MKELYKEYEGKKIRIRTHDGYICGYSEIRKSFILGFRFDFGWNYLEDEDVIIVPAVSYLYIDLEDQRLKIFKFGR